MEKYYSCLGNMQIITDLIILIILSFHLDNSQRAVDITNSIAVMILRDLQYPLYGGTGGFQEFNEDT